MADVSVNASLSNQSDADLVAACRRGDEAAWETLVQRYQRLVYAIPRRSGMDDDQVAEVFQRTFVKVVENLDRISQPERLSAWLITTAKRETWRYGRQMRASISLSGQESEVNDGADSEIDLPDEGPLPGDDLIELEQQHEIRTALTKLDPRCQTLLTLLYYRAEPPAYAVIARELGTSEGSIGPTRARCLEKLKKILEL
jgi:RNA polymerase sigma factor (sigma-70 family)